VIDLVRATQVELLKLRRTLALAFAIIVPLVVIVMTTVLILSRDPGSRIGGPSNPWDTVMLNFVLFLWCIVALGPFVALETALLAGLEHRENAWKHLFALPVSRWSIYAAKLIIAAGLVVLSTGVLDLGFAAEGLLLVTVRPDLGLTLPIPWSSLLLRSADFTLAAALVLTIQSWVATRWRSFPLAAGLGIAGSIAGLVLSISQRAATIASFFPWSLPFIALNRPESAVRVEVQTTALLVGLVGGLMFAVLSCWDITRQDVA
jgi:lantibiotic transport system permease protein